MNRVFQVCFKCLSSVFQVSFKCLSSVYVFQVSFKCHSSVFQVLLMHHSKCLMSSSNFFRVNKRPWASRTGPWSATSSSAEVWRPAWCSSWDRGRSSCSARSSPCPTSTSPSRSSMSIMINLYSKLIQNLRCNITHLTVNQMDWISFSKWPK